MLLRGRRRRSNGGCTSAGEARLAVEGRHDEAADGGASHGPKLPAATAPGPCFLDDVEASAALAPSRTELAPTAALAPAAGRARAFPSGSGLRRGGCAERDQSAARVRGSSTVPRHAAMPRSQRRATVPSTTTPWSTAPPSVNARARALHLPRLPRNGKYQRSTPAPFVLLHCQQPLDT